jgi:predicted murein hydrolase (TIGR00659 family)
MEILKNSAVFWIAISIAFFEAGRFLNHKFKASLLNPLIIAIVMVILFLKVTGLTVADYNTGGDVINMMLAPATAALAFSIYNQISALKKFFIPVAGGCIVGSVVSVFSVKLLCGAFGLTDNITAALLPKSVTTPIALEISSQLGGIQAVTVAAVILTGIFGAIASPLMIKIFKIKNPVAAGTAIGTCSHAVGTSKAVALGETEGAMSGIAIGISGLVTVLLAMFFK